jgi:hypothetical protein
MKKTVVYLIGSGIIILFLIIGICIYFTANISATLPPIREYVYEGEALQLIAKMDSLAAKQSGTVFKVDDTVGNKSIGYAYEIIVTFKNGPDSLSYELKCFNTNQMKLKTKLQVIGAHDLASHIGGYGIKADGMKILLDKFDSHIIIPLKNSGVSLEQ